MHVKTKNSSFVFPFPERVFKAKKMMFVTSFHSPSRFVFVNNASQACFTFLLLYFDPQLDIHVPPLSIVSTCL